MCLPRALLAASALILVLAPSASAQQEVRVRTSGFAQAQFNTTTVDERDVGPATGEVALSTFELRRVRITLDAELGDWITARLQPDFGQGRVRLADAWVNFAVAPHAELRVGQFKKPFGRIELTSSSMLPVIERGLRIRHIDAALAEAAARGALPAPGVIGAVPVLGEHYQMLEAMLYTGRDLGVAVHGRVGRLAYSAGLFNGEGPDRRDVTDRKSAAGRIWLPASPALPISVGAGVSYRETTDVDGLAYQVDAEWGRADAPGLRVIGEVTTGENIALAGDRFLGGQLMLLYRVPLAGPRLAAIEPAFRASYGDPSRPRADDHGWLLTPGLGLSLIPRTRLTLNWELYLPGAPGVGGESALRAQAQVSF